VLAAPGDIVSAGTGGSCSFVLTSQAERAAGPGYLGAARPPETGYAGEVDDSAAA
jgi:hypothetical protein